MLSIWSEPGPAPWVQAHAPNARLQAPPPEGGPGNLHLSKGKLDPLFVFIIIGLSVVLDPVPQVKDLFAMGDAARGIKPQTTLLL